MRKKGAFEKGYEVGWSKELFVMKRVINSRKQSICVYELKDLVDEAIEELFL